jgi:hypothetical protein
VTVKTFHLHDGDRVEFVSLKGHRLTGTLIRRPYGRRLHAVVRDDRRVLHLLPSRVFIVGLLRPVEHEV